MVQLSISVGLANVILWAFVEVFLLLISNIATSLIARYSINKRLLSSESVQLNIPKDEIDKLPYNNDLFPAKPGLKFSLTLYRVIVVAISIYVGATLDGQPQINHDGFKTSSSTFLSPERGLLTDNSGDDLNAMSKFSCLRIVDNNLLVLYKGYINPTRNILCADGQATPTKHVLLRAEIRATFRTGKTGKDMQSLPMFGSRFETESAKPGLQLRPNVLLVNATNGSGGLTNIASRIVFMERFPDNECLFGMWRSPGLGFERRVDIKLIASCDIQIAALERLLRPKPSFLPPRVAFVYQVVDSVIVGRRETSIPSVVDEEIVAALPVSTIVVMLVFGVLSTAVWLVFRMLIRDGKVNANIGDARYVGMVLAPGAKRVLFQWDEQSERVVWEVHEGGESDMKRGTSSADGI